MSCSCPHAKLKCINPYELIRKYECEACNEIMMCICDKERGNRFLPHQLKYGVRLENRERVLVTLSFQSSICAECRSEEAIHAPKKSRPGATSKITRYYWREIYFETIKRYFDAHPELTLDCYSLIPFEKLKEEQKEIRLAVIADLKILYSKNPKYNFNEVTQSQIINEVSAEIITVQGEYVKTTGRKAGVLHEGNIYTVEQYAMKLSEKKGYIALETESAPFHVLFGIFMWPIIQDSQDTNVRAVSFGDRNDFAQKKESCEIITTLLPNDFGTSSYYSRRVDIIKSHIRELHHTDISSLFIEWIEPGFHFRQYLWAHREDDVQKAINVLKIIGNDNLLKILDYV